MNKTAILLLILGLAFTLFTGLSFITWKNVVDIGKLKISANTNHSISWSPILGVTLLAAVAGLYLLRMKNSTRI
jgi:LPXTG-motif cell wall-anchored protein